MKKINFSLIETYSTPRRITVIIKGLKQKIAESIKEIRGPNTSADKRAIEGFMKSQSLSNQKLLLKKEIKGKEYFFFEKKN